MGVINEAESSGAASAEDGSKAKKHDIFFRELLLKSHLYFLEMSSFNLSLETLASSGWITSRIYMKDLPFIYGIVACW